MTHTTSAATIRSAAAWLGYGNADLARLTGRNPATVTRWTKGDGAPAAESLPSLSAALGIDPHVLVVAIREPQDAYRPWAPERLAAWRAGGESRRIGWHDPIPLTHADGSMREVTSINGLIAYRLLCLDNHFPKRPS
jgi:transcriptional regulator with XRE-family HTH domain